jgi:hypothetical protein
MMTQVRAWVEKRVREIDMVVVPFRLNAVAGFSRKFLPPPLDGLRARGWLFWNQRRSDERTRSGIVPPGTPDGSSCGGLRVLQQR